MKIAFVSTMSGAPWGGSEELWSGAAERILQAGHETHVGVFDWPEPRPMIRKLRQGGARLHLRPRPQALRSRLWRKFLPNSEFAWLGRVRPNLLIISQGANFDGVGWMMAAQSQAIDYIPVAHMAAGACWPPSDQSQAAASGYLAARLCCFVSEGNRWLTERQIAAHLQRVRIVRNPCNVDYHADPPWPKSMTPLQLACVARLCPDAKGQDLLIDVLSRPKWRSRNLLVRFFGQGPGLDHLRRLCGMLNVEAVRFAGHVSDIERIWSEHHALVLPSRFEGMPMALVEAMLCRRAALVTNVGGNAELVRDGLTGFVAAAPDADLLDQAMERLWAGREQLRAMGRAAGESIRRAVPPDPVGQFVELILGNAPSALRPTEAAAPIPA